MEDPKGIPRKTLETLENKLSVGDYYDAHQLIRTLSRRMLGLNRMSDALYLVLTYAQKFAGLGQDELGVDLGVYYISICKDNCLQGTTSKAVRLRHLLESLKDSNCKTVSTLLQEVLHFLTKYQATNDPDATEGMDGELCLIHSLGAEIYESTQEYGKAQIHRLAARNAEGLVALLLMWEENVYESERQLLVLRLICILISCGYVATASSVLELLGIEWENENLEPPLQLSYLMVEAAKCKNLAFFQAVKTKFALVLRRDATLQNLIETIEQNCFGVKRYVPNNVMSLFGM